jgi:hypothetical protein
VCPWSRWPPRCAHDDRAQGLSVATAVVVVAVVALVVVAVSGGGGSGTRPVGGNIKRSVAGGFRSEVCDGKWDCTWRRDTNFPCGSSVRLRQLDFELVDAGRRRRRRSDHCRCRDFWRRGDTGDIVMVVVHLCEPACPVLLVGDASLSVLSSSISNRNRDPANPLFSWL